MVGCPWRGQFITPKRRSGRAPQGSPSYTGGHRLEVPLFPCCTTPGCAIVIRAYRLQIARIGITSSAELAREEERISKKKAMERCPIRDIKIKHLLKNALTTEIDSREVYMKGIDHSYYYEGYTTFKAEEL